MDTGVHLWTGAKVSHAKAGEVAGAGAKAKCGAPGTLLGSAVHRQTQQLLWGGRWLQVLVGRFSRGSSENGFGGWRSKGGKKGPS